MAAGKLAPLFTCPKCKALYQLIKVEAGLGTADTEVRCKVCDGPPRWAGREVCSEVPVERGHPTGAPQVAARRIPTLIDPVTGCCLTA
jgi:predicted Zn finger-like uncharacterized protein